MRTYDGHGNETVSKARQAERLPCCRESPTGVCEQHIDGHMARLQKDFGYEWLTSRGYRRARARAAARISRNMEKPTD